MLRIYFDWNCITHLKDSEGEKLFDYIDNITCLVPL